MAEFEESRAINDGGQISNEDGHKRNEHLQEEETEEHVGEKVRNGHEISNTESRAEKSPGTKQDRISICEKTTKSREIYQQVRKQSIITLCKKSKGRIFFLRTP